MHTSAEKQSMHALRSVFTYPERDLTSDDARTLFAETISLLFNEIKMGTTDERDRCIFVSVLLMLMSILKTRLSIDTSGIDPPNPRLNLKKRHDASEQKANIMKPQALLLNTADLSSSGQPY